jgi:outer membrane lipoprotein-sorting protein
VEGARARLEDAWRSFVDLRSRADITIRQGKRVQRLSGVLLLKAPAAFRFEALSPFGPPLLAVAGSAESVTVWEVLRNRAYLLRHSRRKPPLVGVAVRGGSSGAPGRSGRPMPAPRAGSLLPPDETGSSLQLSGSEGNQRIWLDATGRPLKVEWTEGKSPLRVTIARTEDAAAAPGPREIRLETLDGKLEVSVVYREPRLDSGFEAALLPLTVPQGVEIQDFR